MPETRPVEPYHEAVARFKREYLVAMLEAHGGNRTYAAAALKLQRTHLLRLIREFGLREEAKGKPPTLPRPLAR